MSKLLNSIKAYNEITEQCDESLKNYKLKVAANKIWDICKESPEMGNAVMDLIGVEAYQKVMKRATFK